MPHQTLTVMIIRDGLFFDYRDALFEKTANNLDDVPKKFTKKHCFLWIVVVSYSERFIKLFVSKFKFSYHSIIILQFKYISIKGEYHGIY